MNDRSSLVLLFLIRSRIISLLNDHFISSMHALRPSQVPEYLRNTSFFLGLNVADDDEFSIPFNHMKLNMNVATTADMTELLNTIRFWGLDTFPEPIYNFASLRPPKQLEPILEPFLIDLPFITAMCSIVSEVKDSGARLEKVMEIGYLDGVRHIHRKLEGTFTARAIALAAGKGALECLQYALIDVTPNLFDHQFDIFSEAVRNGQMDSILFLQRRGFSMFYRNSHSLFHRLLDRLKCAADLTQIAALSGHCEILKYLHSQGCFVHEAAKAAADAGHWDCLEYALEHNALLRGEWEYTEKGSLAQRLACAQQLKLFPLALSRGDKIDAQAAVFIAAAGNSECIKLCFDHGIRPSIYLVALVAVKGHLGCLQLLHEVCTLAAEATGQALNWLTYAAKVGESNLRPTDIAQMAAKAQQWECLRLLISHDCPMDPSLLVCLVQAEQLELYRLAVTHGCEVPVLLACVVAADGNLSLPQHALEHRCERSEEILRVAAHHGQLPCLKYARAQGCLWSALVTMEAAHGGHLECLQYLHEHGCPWDARVRSEKRKECIADYADAHDCLF